MIDELNAPGAAATHEAWWPRNLFEAGIGWIIVTRFKSRRTRAETSVFLVDTHCLGVKNVIVHDGPVELYRSRILERAQQEDDVIAVEPCCARKLVERAVAYALNLGFPPHPDYKKGARVFGGIRAEDCPREFTFGQDGKPLYVRGPHETELQAQAIVNHLMRRCGEDNFHYLVRLDNPDDEA